MLGRLPAGEDGFDEDAHGSFGRVPAADDAESEAFLLSDALAEHHLASTSRSMKPPVHCCCCCGVSINSPGGKRKSWSASDASPRHRLDPRLWPEL